MQAKDANGNRTDEQSDKKNQWGLPAGPGGIDTIEDISDWETSVERPSEADGRSILVCMNRHSDYRIHITKRNDEYVVVTMRFGYNTHENRPPIPIEKERTRVTIQTDSIIREVRDLCREYSSPTGNSPSHPQYN